MRTNYKCMYLIDSHLYKKKILTENLVSSERSPALHFPNTYTNHENPLEKESDTKTALNQVFSSDISDGKLKKESNTEQKNTLTESESIAGMNENENCVYNMAISYTAYQWVWLTLF